MGRNRVQECKRELEKAGYRLTEQRLAVAEQVMTQSKAFTAEDLYRQLTGRGIGRATVFRTVKILLDVGCLERVHLDQGCNFYAVVQTAEHQHRIVCRNCGRVDYLVTCPLQGCEQKDVRYQGYEVAGHHLEFFGICSSCQD